MSNFWLLGTFTELTAEKPLLQQKAFVEDLLLTAGVTAGCSTQHIASELEPGCVTFRWF